MTPHDLLAAFETLAEAPDGIARLRELVLQLAVRGKLVPQDPNDEPACVLLERIAAEKARLVKERKIPKPKPLLPVDEDEVRFEVPEGWMWCRIDDCFDVVGGIQKSGKRQPVQNTYPYLRVANVQRGQIDLHEIHRFELFEGELERWRLTPGDLLVVEGNGSEYEIGRCARWNGEIVDCVHQNHLIRCRPLAEAIEHFMLRYLNSPTGIQTMKELAVTTSGLYNLSVGKIKDIEIPLPPLPEQRRIIAKVDALMALLDRLEAARSERETTRTALRDAAMAALRDAPDAGAVEATWTRIAERMDDLFTDPADVAPLRQTILQLAVRGKLVPQDPNDEPVCLLLERIAAEKARLVKEGKLAKPKPLWPVSKDEIPFAVPEGWAWCRFGTITDSRLGKMLDKSKNRGALRPYLRNANVQWFRFELDDILEIRLEDHEVEEYSIMSGDLLICEGGEPGRAAICDASVGGMAFQKALHRARPFGGVVVKYLAYLLRCDTASGHLEQYFTGATIKHFTGQALASYVIPLPSIAEQHRIVAKVDALMALCDALEARLAVAREAQAAFAAAAVHHLDA